ncbi:protein kinase domain-containing protein [Streptomyces sp. BI20]|uniref:serine/threonine-protein kinase n=1 Tax=Streptomyces sp. BI20 TaxID=3403460 RepID=UPI003C7208B1
MAESRLIHGRYRSLDLIGRGGMGEVWRARDEALGRHVAVKCLKPLGAEQDAQFTQVMRERFRREARVAASLQHRGVTVVHDFGDDSGAGGMLFLVMELLDGRNLSQLMAEAEDRPLPVDVVVDIAEQVAAALAYTHDQGVVHRDLKPANIMRLTDGTVKICDFGIARLAHDIGFTAKLTGGGMAMGTPHYMSPEQISGAEVDHSSDLYSLGCVLYEIATGAPPFDLGDSWSVLVGHRDTLPVPPRRHRPELPAEFERVVLWLLAKRPEDRPADARVLHRALVENRRLAQGGGPAPEPPPPALPGWAREIPAGRKAGVESRPASGAWAQLHGTWTKGPAPLTAGGGPTDPRLTLMGPLAPGPTPGPTGPTGAPDAPDPSETQDAAALEHARRLARAGRLGEALAAHIHLASARNDRLGPEHPDTLAARHEIGHCLGLLGRRQEALALHREVVDARVRALGPDHPDTLLSRHSLACALGRLDRHAEAYAAALAAAEARARVLGADHPDTLLSRYENAWTLGCLDRWEEALIEYRTVADGRARALGPDHADTLAARYEVGIALGRLGRGAEALELYGDLVRDRTRAYGDRDPETLRARHVYGVNLGRLGRWTEAVEEARAVGVLRARVLGPDHPDTLVSRREIAVGLGRLGRWGEALTLHREISAARERALGADHPHTLDALGDEAHCLDRLGRHQEAGARRRRAAELRGRGHGHASALPPADPPAAEAASADPAERPVTAGGS